jgi:hypothetical protein
MESFSASLLLRRLRSYESPCSQMPAPAEQRVTAKGDEIGRRLCMDRATTGNSKMDCKVSKLPDLVAPQGILETFIPKAELQVIIRERKNEP